MPTKRTPLILSLLACLFATHCGSSDSSMSEVDACNEIVETLCHKVFNCYSTEELAAAQSRYGLNASDCKTKLQSKSCTPDEAKCDLGQTFHPDRAMECVAQYRALSCNDIKSTSVPSPAACQLMCTL